MNKKRLLGLLTVACACGVIICVGVLSQNSRQAHVYDSDGNELAAVSLNDESFVYDTVLQDNSYVDATCEQAVKEIAAKENLTEEEARKYLVKNELNIETCFQQDKYDALRSAYEQDQKLLDCNFGAVVTDDEGRMIASYGSSNSGDDTNYILDQHYAGSVIKPLSVYGPAIETGAINWSTMIVDEPYTQVENDEGELVNWPTNTEEYTFSDTTIADAVTKSMNTIAVRTAKLYGVANACDFLSNNFGINLDKEYELIHSSGEDEVIGDIALGYIKAGVSVKDIAGFYQVFANGGTYTEPTSITEITDKEGNFYSSPTSESRQVFSTETAYIVNRLLKNVVSQEGTAADAAIEGLDLCGKTGTSNSFQNNWFTAVVPGYVISAWYGNNLENQNRERNEAVTVVHDTLENMDLTQAGSFQQPDNVIQAEYCTKTGLLATEQCDKTQTGFYNKSDIPLKCNCQ